MGVHSIKTNVFQIKKKEQSGKINLPNTHDRNATRKRLQKKLQERNEGKVDVNKKD